MGARPKSRVGEPCPYLGLRPFFEQDAKWFFGREDQTDDLLRMLGRKRFLAVTGTSGSGKSSLVRAGLIPSLKRGYMPGSTARWRVAVARPRGDPFGELATALSEDASLGPDDSRPAMLHRSSQGLIEAARARLGPDDSLLVVIDQFEEIFRFKNESDLTGDESDAFVKLLLAAADQVETPIYIVLTMRSDYLGDCSVFRGLPEALNGSQYLAPVLTRAQLREAIEGPAQARGVELAPELSQRLLNDVGHGLEQELDQLPVLQHALSRTWAKGEGDERLEMRHYEAAGRMAGALDQHADELYRVLDDRGRAIARKVFQRLTEKESQGRDIRRATSFGELVKLTGAPRDEVLAVIEQYRGFLVTAEPGKIRGDSIVDITHEALIRQWRRLRGWAAEEAETARIYRRLADDASHSESEPWRGARLLDAQKLKKEEGWNDAWARRYAASTRGGEEYRKVEAFLDMSERRRRRAIRLRWASIAAALMLALGLFWYYARQRERRIADNAERQTLTAQLGALQDQVSEREELIRGLETAVEDLRKLQEQAQLNNDQVLARALAEQQRDFEKKLAASRTANETSKGSVKQIDEELQKYNAAPMQQAMPRK